jgi:hypothetical protein
MTLPRRIGLGLLAAGVLVAVFLMYTQPDFLVQMANQVWSCF